MDIRLQESLWEMHICSYYSKRFAFIHLDIHLSVCIASTQTHRGHQLILVCRHGTKIEIWRECVRIVRGLCVCAKRGMDPPIYFQTFAECDQRTLLSGRLMILVKWSSWVYYVKVSLLM